MSDNTDMASNGTELYVHKLFELADQYIEQVLDGDVDKASKYFRDLIFYIADRIEKPDNDDIESLDKLFSAYARLCTRHDKLPTVQCFSFLTGINNSTFTDWKNGEYRNKLYYTLDGERIDNINTWRFNHKGQEYKEVSSTTYSQAVKKWLDTCKNFVVDELSNAKLANPNLIFTAKAAYGMRETSPIPAPATDNKPILTADCLPRLDGSGDWKPSGSVNELPQLENS